ncbi:hypothetical protein ACFY1C_20000 [Streptomyces sp. NPDC001279]|uniref:hypothetical protein n=1 Tax=Streptomyces sp. NPDC001279 TaxID=3364556 RepID=UPI0036CED854
MKRDRRGNPVLTDWCSAWCRHWDSAAKNALYNDDARQAATLMEAVAVLDSRKSGGDPVHGVQIIDSTRWVVHTDAHASARRHRRPAHAAA